MKYLWRGALCSALVCTAATAGAANHTIVVTHELDAARPGAIVNVPFADIDKVAPGLRMFHVVVRDARGRSLPLQVTNYQHDHRGARYDELVFQYDFAAGEKRATFTLEYYWSYYYSYYGPPGYPNVVERLGDNTYLVVEGDVTTTGTAAGLTGTLRGDITHWDSRFPANARWLGECSGTNIQFRVTPR